MNQLFLILAANQQDFSWIPFFADIATIAAGFGAAAALGFDVYARLFGKQLDLYFSIPTSTYSTEPTIKLDLTNYGDASARIISIKTTPPWEELCSQENKSLMDYASDYTLSITDTLEFPLSIEKITELLTNYYKNEYNLEKPFHIQVTLTYKPLARTLGKKIKEKHYDTNLTCAYMKICPLSTIIPDHEAEKQLKEFLKQLTNP